MIIRLRHMWLGLRLLPSLVGSPQKRSLLREMYHFCQQLPTELKRPFPIALAHLSTKTISNSNFTSEKQTRELADLAALLDRRSSLGLCLRRSLTRYYFLRRLSVPVVVQFGARFVGTEADRDVTGHAWLIRNGRSYHEIDADWQGFTVMFSWPQEAA